MICWMFPGQPISFVDSLCNDPEFLEIAQLCREITGFNPIDPSISDLKESVRLQLFGTCISLFHIKLLMGQGSMPNLVAEHSMGIYAALVAAGSIDCETAMALTCRIGTAMAQMGLSREYALGCVIGLPFGSLKTIAAENGVYIANHNTSRHFLLAGDRVQVEAASAEATAAGAFSVRVFPCDAPLHTPLIEELGGVLLTIVADFSYREPLIPLIEHIGQSALTAATIPLFLVDELSRPVYWETTYRTLRSRGVTRFKEVGAGSALTKFNRWIDSES